MFKELASLFYIERESRYGVAARVSMATIFIAYSLLIALNKSAGLHELSLSLSLELSLIFFLVWIDGRLRGYLNGMKVIMLFIILASLFYLLSFFTGIGPKSLISIAVGLEKTALLITPFTLLATWFTPSEIGFILDRLGLGKASVVFRSAISKMPLLFIDISDSIHTIKIKYGPKKVYKSIYYLLLESMLLGNEFYEAYYVYGLPSSRVEFVKRKGGDLLVSALVILTLLASYLFLFLD